jgi:SAM-dependent methyltransferase
VGVADPSALDPRPHVYRGLAESFGVHAERYDRTRPAYPAALVARILAASAGRSVLDVGCGTGIEARQFQAAGSAVLGIDPDERMADLARRRGLEVEVARFEDWDPAGRTFDLVIAGTAWHWVDPKAGATKAAQVLRPNGRLAPFHTLFQLPRPVAEALGEAYRRVLPSSPVDLPDHLLKPAVDAYQPVFTAIADGIRGTGVFSEPEQWRFDWDLTYARDAWVEQLSTFGGLTGLPADQLAQLQGATAAAIDDLGGSVAVAYSAVAVTAVLGPVGP